MRAGVKGGRYWLIEVGRVRKGIKYESWGKRALAVF